MLYTKNKSYPKPLPFRIVLSDGRTRTDPTTFTEEEIIDAGYIAVDDPPELLENQSLQWDYVNAQWTVNTLTQEEIDANEQSKINIQWNNIRIQRDQLMRNFEWRYNRYDRETRLGLTPTDTLSELDSYMQSLADITNQEDPFNIVWPNYGADSDEI